MITIVNIPQPNETGPVTLESLIESLQEQVQMNIEFFRKHNDEHLLKHGVAVNLTKVEMDFLMEKRTDR